MPINVNLLFDKIMKDPDVIPEEGQEKKDLAMGMVLQRATQAANNEKALSMANSDNPVSKLLDFVTISKSFDDDVLGQMILLMLKKGTPDFINHLQEIGKTRGKKVDINPSGKGSELNTLYRSLMSSYHPDLARGLYSIPAIDEDGKVKGTEGDHLDEEMHRMAGIFKNELDKIGKVLNNFNDNVIRTMKPDETVEGALERFEADALDKKHRLGQATIKKAQAMRSQTTGEVDGKPIPRKFPNAWAYAVSDEYREERRKTGRFDRKKPLNQVPKIPDIFNETSYPTNFHNMEKSLRENFDTDGTLKIQTSLNDYKIRADRLREIRDTLKKNNPDVKFDPNHTAFLDEKDKFGKKILLNAAQINKYLLDVDPEVTRDADGKLTGPVWGGTTQKTETKSKVPPPSPPPSSEQKPEEQPKTFDEVLEENDPHRKEDLDAAAADIKAEEQRQNDAAKAAPPYVPVNPKVGRRRAKELEALGYTTADMQTLTDEQLVHIMRTNDGPAAMRRNMANAPKPPTPPQEPVPEADDTADAAGAADVQAEEINLPNEEAAEHIKTHFKITDAEYEQRAAAGEFSDSLNIDDAVKTYPVREATTEERKQRKEQRRKEDSKEKTHARMEPGDVIQTKGIHAIDQTYAAGKEAVLQHFYRDKDNETDHALFRYTDGSGGFTAMSPSAGVEDRKWKAIAYPEGEWNEVVKDHNDNMQEFKATPYDGTEHKASRPEEPVGETPSQAQEEPKVDAEEPAAKEPVVETPAAAEEPVDEAPSEAQEKAPEPEPTKTENKFTGNRFARAVLVSWYKDKFEEHEALGEFNDITGADSARAHLINVAEERQKKEETQRQTEGTGQQEVSTPPSRGITLSVAAQNHLKKHLGEEEFNKRVKADAFKGVNNIRQAKQHLADHPSPDTKPVDEQPAAETEVPPAAQEGEPTSGQGKFDFGDEESQQQKEPVAETPPPSGEESAGAGEGEEQPPTGEATGEPEEVPADPEKPTIQSIAAKLGLPEDRIQELVTHHQQANDILYRSEDDYLKHLDGLKDTDDFKAARKELQGIQTKKAAADKAAAATKTNEEKASDAKTAKDEADAAKQKEKDFKDSADKVDSLIDGSGVTDKATATDKYREILEHEAKYGDSVKSTTTAKLAKAKDLLRVDHKANAQLAENLAGAHAAATNDINASDSTDEEKAEAHAKQQTTHEKAIAQAHQKMKTDDSFNEHVSGESGSAARRNAFDNNDSDRLIHTDKDGKVTHSEFMDSRLHEGRHKVEEKGMAGGAAAHHNDHYKVHGDIKREDGGVEGTRPTQTHHDWDTGGPEGQHGDVGQEQMQAYKEQAEKVKQLEDEMPSAGFEAARKAHSKELDTQKAKLEKMDDESGGALSTMMSDTDKEQQRIDRGQPPPPGISPFPGGVWAAGIHHWVSPDKLSEIQSGLGEGESHYIAPHDVQNMLGHEDVATSDAHADGSKPHQGGMLITGSGVHRVTDIKAGTPLTLKQNLGKNASHGSEADLASHALATKLTERGVMGTDQKGDTTHEETSSRKIEVGELGAVGNDLHGRASHTGGNTVVGPMSSQFVKTVKKVKDAAPTKEAKSKLETAMGRFRAIRDAAAKKGKRKAIETSQGGMSAVRNLHRAMAGEFGERDAGVKESLRMLGSDVKRGVKEIKEGAAQSSPAVGIGQIRQGMRERKKKFDAAKTAQRESPEE